MSKSEFELLLEEEFKPSTQKCSENSFITATPVLITRQGAYISIPGRKADSFIPADQLPATFPLVENQPAEFLVVSESGEDGEMKLSYSWTAAKKVFEAGQTVEIVIKRLKEKYQHNRDKVWYDGAEVSIPSLGNLTAFVPWTQLVQKNLGEGLVRQKFEAKILEIAEVQLDNGRQQRRLIVSPLEVQIEKRLRYYESLKVGDVVAAKVQKLEKTYAVIALSTGATGLVLASDFAPYGEAEGLSQAAKDDSHLEFEVTEVDLSDRVKPKLKLSRRAVIVRQRQQELLARLKVGDIVSARITSFPQKGWGAFVLVEECQWGSISNRELPVKEARAQEFLTKNQIVRARFLGVHPDSGNLTLSLKNVQ